MKVNLLWNRILQYNDNTSTANAIDVATLGRKYYGNIRINRVEPSSLTSAGRHIVKLKPSVVQ